MADQLEAAFQRWKTMAEIQLKFIEQLGQYKLESAKTELVNAVAAGQWAVARMKARVAKELEASLHRLNRVRAQYRSRAKRLDRQARAAAKIRSGEDLPPSQLPLMWAAYRVFERQAPVAILEQINSTSLHPSARNGSSYLDTRNPQITCQDPPETVDNVHALIGWVKRKRYVPRRGTQAYRQIVAAFAQIAQVADNEITQLQTYLQEMERRTLDAWKPLVIAALPDSIDVKKIVKAGL